VPLKFPVIPSGLNFSKQIPPDSEWVILDTPPGNPDIIRAALKWADLAVLPTRPGALDLIQLIPVLDESERSSTPAAVLLVQTRAGVKETDEIKEILADRQVMVIETQIPLRARTSRLAMAHPGARDLLASGYQDIANELKEAFQ
jgi:chromosome partitioning protein